MSKIQKKIGCSCFWKWTEFYNYFFLEGYAEYFMLSDCCLKQHLIILPPPIFSIFGGEISRNVALTIWPVKIWLTIVTFKITIWIFRFWKNSFQFWVDVILQKEIFNLLKAVEKTPLFTPPPPKKKSKYPISSTLS